MKKRRERKPSVILSGKEYRLVVSLDVVFLEKMDGNDALNNKRWTLVDGGSAFFGTHYVCEQRSALADLAEALVRKRNARRKRASKKRRGASEDREET